MCGIFEISVAKDSNLTTSVVKKITRSLFLLSESMGKEANIRRCSKYLMPETTRFIEFEKNSVGFLYLSPEALQKGLTSLLLFLLFTLFFLNAVGGTYKAQ